jgi:single-strand DNA-binding protein
MASLNKVFLMGNLTRDPELRYTPSGTPVCEFGLAVNRRYTTREGEQRDETCFVDVTMWGKRGVVISEYFTKGRPIFIEGRLKYDSWESAEGRRSKLTVVAENFEFMGGRGGADRGEEPTGGRRAAPGRQDRRPAPRDEAPPDEGYDVADDEIPF